MPESGKDCGVLLLRKPYTKYLTARGSTSVDKYARTNEIVDHNLCSQIGMRRVEAKLRDDPQRKACKFLVGRNCHVSPDGQGLVLDLMGALLLFLDQQLPTPSLPHGKRD